jgi:hypothetical protein
MKKVTMFLALLFFSASLFAQAPKPILLRLELENGYKCRVSVWVNDKKISKYFYTVAGNSLIVKDSIYCKNGFDAIKFEVDGKINISNYKNVKYDSLLNIRIKSGYILNIITNNKSQQKIKLVNK